MVAIRFMKGRLAYATGLSTLLCRLLRRLQFPRPVYQFLQLALDGCIADLLILQYTIGVNGNDGKTVPLAPSTAGRRRFTYYLKRP